MTCHLALLATSQAPDTECVQKLMFGALDAANENFACRLSCKQANSSEISKLAAHRVLKTELGIPSRWESIGCYNTYHVDAWFLTAYQSSVSARTCCRWSHCGWPGAFAHHRSGCLNQSVHGFQYHITRCSTAGSDDNDTRSWSIPCCCCQNRITIYHERLMSMHSSCEYQIIQSIFRRSDIRCNNMNKGR